ncbi:hypothetical protein [Flavisolibacter nicotianae]|uniref:hypothetical protein n=1 Tax=Flavisolibacter nicotianae TaxID=2364882 RepID=UPI000EAC18DE|nr:hypothetical protein [Flavisolibacter nicotianae]
MKRILFVSVLALALGACSKDKFKTVPTVKINSIGPSEARNGDIIQVFATVTDKEGDLQDSVIVVRKKFNGSTLLSTDSSAKVSLKGLGSPVKDKIELRISISYGKLLPEFALYQELERDFDREFSVGLIVRDNAGNRSEYVESDRITLKKF